MKTLETLPAWRRTEVERSREHLKTGTYTRPETGPVLYWTSVLPEIRPVPVHVFEDALTEAPKGQREACAAELDRFMADYCKAQAGREVTAEERFEARAAHGPGVKLVDVFTGRTFTT